MYRIYGCIISGIIIIIGFVHKRSQQNMSIPIGALNKNVFTNNFQYKSTQIVYIFQLNAAQNKLLTVGFVWDVCCSFSPRVNVFVLRHKPKQNIREGAKKTNHPTCNETEHLFKFTVEIYIYNMVYKITGQVDNKHVYST